MNDATYNNVFGYSRMEWDIRDLTTDEIEFMGDDLYNLYMKAEEMKNNPSKYTKEDRLCLMKEMAFEQKAFKEHWTKDEKDDQLAKFEHLYEKELKKAGKKISSLFEFLKCWTEDCSDN